MASPIRSSRSAIGSIRAQSSPVVVNLVTNTPPPVVVVPPINLDPAQTQAGISNLVAGVSSVVVLPSVNLFDGKDHDIHIHIHGKDGSSTTTIR